MSCSLWRWTEECDTHDCVGDCDLCSYNNEDEELLPCPFCGGTDFEFTGKDIYYELLGEHGSACIRLSCSKCSLDLYEHSDDVKDYFKKKDRLIKKWNTRYIISTIYNINTESLK